MRTVRRLERNEIETFWTIDRSEIHHNIYRVENGSLVLTPYYFEIPGWRTKDKEGDTAELYRCYDRGGVLIGMYEDVELIGVAVVDTKPVDAYHEARQLKLLYVSRNYRGQGVGKRLFEEAQSFARSLGAAQLYISATPTENTVNFYLQRGSRLAIPPDPKLLALEPDDVHLLSEL